MKSYETDLCKGPIFKQIILYAIPLMLSGVLQLLYNMVDIVVVGQFAGKESLAAVGSTSSLINLITNLFIGISSGCCIVVATYYGANRAENLSKSVHTSMTIAVYSGIILAIFGFFSAKGLLVLTGTPDDVIELASLYMKIYLLGMPFFMIFNFGSSILNAVGDTKRPLYYLTISGIVNVVLNLVFVIVFHLGVAGVAIATVISQIVSCVFVVLCLMRMDGVLRLDLKKLKIDKHELSIIFRNGIPNGISRSVFSFSNVIIQSSVNSLGSAVMAGSAAAANIEGIVYTAMYSVAQTALTFTSQNLGANNIKRIKQGHNMCLIIVIVVGLSLGGLAYIFGPQLLKIYSSDPSIIPSGIIRLKYVCIFYFLCGCMDVETSTLKGLSYSFFTMISSIVGVCGVRVLWIYTVFAKYRTVDTIFISYPITWASLYVFYIFAYHIIMKRKMRNLC